MIRAAGLHEEDIVAVVSRASSDRALCAATYLPAEMDADGVRTWLEQRPRWCWVIRVDDVPVGMLELRPPDISVRGLVPESTMEREVWLLPEWRGQGIVVSGMQVVRGELLDAGVHHVVGIAWETNISAIAGMRNAGFTRLGRVWWEGEGTAGGWCEAWIGELEGRGEAG